LDLATHRACSLKPRTRFVRVILFNPIIIPFRLSQFWILFGGIPKNWYINIASLTKYSFLFFLPSSLIVLESLPATFFSGI